MPSSLVFAALAMAWLVILVPMVARRRREVVRTADSALAARVLHRGGGSGVASGPGAGGGAGPVRREEVAMSEPTGDGEPDRRYRPGRGGFDPEAAELAARARYGLRQRIVLGLLLTALATGLLAGFALPILWWAHGFADVCLVAYLAYLRRQVRIEQEIRYRRAIRAARVRRALPRAADPAPPEPEPEPAPRAPQRPPPHPGATIVELDDEDPAFHELDAESQPSYRRAAGQ